VARPKESGHGIEIPNDTYVCLGSVAALNPQFTKTLIICLLSLQKQTILLTAQSDYFLAYICSDLIFIESISISLVYTLQVKAK